MNTPELLCILDYIKIYPNIILNYNNILDYIKN